MMSKKTVDVKHCHSHHPRDLMSIITPDDLYPKAVLSKSKFKLDEFSHDCLRSEGAAAVEDEGVAGEEGGLG